MAIIKIGSIESLSARTTDEVLRKFPSLKALGGISEFTEVTRAAQPLPLVFPQSSEFRGIGLKKITLNKGFGGFLGNIFKATNNVYFYAWAWDLSGNPIIEYPGTVTGLKCLIPMKNKSTREFLGTGVNLFPAQQVNGGIWVRIMIWECDQNLRDLGNTLKEISTTIKGSPLTDLLKQLALAGGLSTATFALAETAAIELTGLLSALLRKNSDDYVDFFEGFFPAHLPWVAGTEVSKGYGCNIELSKY